MKCLITGCGGFIGAHLAAYLLEQGLSVYGTVHHSQETLGPIRDRLTLFPCDVTDRRRMEEILSTVRPQQVFHLAAQDLPTRSWEDPEGTLEVNLLGTLYLFEAIRKQGLPCIILLMGSSAEYGAPQAEDGVIREDAVLEPLSPYGVSKAGANLLASVYARAYQMEIVRVRPFFVIGPGQAQNVCAEFARRIAEIEEGFADVLTVGNLEAVRDFVDVRDAIHALGLLAEKGLPGEAYNLCSGKGYRIQELLDGLCARSVKRVVVQADPRKLRPSDSPMLIGDNMKLRRLGWQPKIRLEKTLEDTLEFWRDQVRREARV